MAAQIRVERIVFFLMSKNNVANDLVFPFKTGSPVIKSTPSAKKRTFKNIINDHINTEKSDTYSVRSGNLVKKVYEVVNLTGCAMNLEVLPTWTKGVPRYFKSNNFNQVSINNMVIPRTQSLISTYHLHQYTLPPPKNLEVIMTPLILTKISAAYVTLDI